MAKLKVWGGLSFVFGRQNRTIVAAKTKKEAVIILHSSKVSPFITMQHFNTYWMEIGNKIELEVANRVGVWVTKERWNSKPEDYIEFPYWLTKNETPQGPKTSM